LYKPDGVWHSGDLNVGGFPLRLNLAPLGGACPVIDAILYSPRLLMRPLVPRDAALLLCYVQENRAWLAPWEPAHPERYFTLEGQRSILRQCEEDRRAGTGILFGIFERGDESGTLWGRISIAGIVRGIWQNGYVGYSIDSRRAGQGYMTEALERLVTYGLGEMGLHRLQVSIIPRNEASLRVVRKCRFRYEGRALGYLLINDVWEDHEIFALTKDDLARR